MDTEKKEIRKEKGTKKPYFKPSFQSEKVFETMALACGKINATQSSCSHNKKNS